MTPSTAVPNSRCHISRATVPPKEKSGTSVRFCTQRPGCVPKMPTRAGSSGITGSSGTGSKSDDEACVVRVMRPSSVWTSAMAPMMPPSERHSALFWNTTR